MDVTALSVFENRCLINGQWIGTGGTASRQRIDVTDPATGELISSVPVLSEAQIHESVQTAQAAQVLWKKYSPQQRADILKKWFNLMHEHKEELATLLTLEQGKPLKESRGEITYAASYLEWYAEEGKRAYGDIIPSADNSEVLVFKEPVGVCAAITPWNFPAGMITRKVAPALAAGCTMILKPASETPLTALALAKLATEAGVPAGVLNVVTGSSTLIGKILTESPVVKKLSFTGSTPIGAKLMEQSAPTIKKLSLELGGNAPVLVFNDCNLELAVQQVLDCKFRNAGQTCVCANRIYVQSGVYDEFLEKLAQKVSQLKVGNGLNESTTVGPLINAKATLKVQEQIDDALAKGAELVTGTAVQQPGNWCVPTVLKNVSQDMLCAKEETFGPLAPVFVFETEDEAVQYANDTEFGLASYVFTQDLNRFIRVSRALEYGMVGVNTGILSNEAAPFGGVKASGLGREGAKYGLEDYLEIKYVCVGNIT